MLNYLGNIKTSLVVFATSLALISFSGLAQKTHHNTQSLDGEWQLIFDHDNQSLPGSTCLLPMPNNMTLSTEQHQKVKELLIPSQAKLDNKESVFKEAFYAVNSFNSTITRCI